MIIFDSEELIENYPNDEREIYLLLYDSIPLGNNKYAANESVCTNHSMFFQVNEKISGMGDAFAVIAQPIAKVIDKLAGTDLVNCPSCKKRQANWNKAMPFESPKRRKT